MLVAQYTIRTFQFQEIDLVDTLKRNSPALLPRQHPGPRTVASGFWGAMREEPSIPIGRIQEILSLVIVHHSPKKDNVEYSFCVELYWPDPQRQNPVLMYQNRGSFGMGKSDDEVPCKFFAWRLKIARNNTV